MPITLSCTCQARLKVPDTAAGRKIKCPKCGNAVSVPAADAPIPDPAPKPPVEPPISPVRTPAQIPPGAPIAVACTCGAKLRVPTAAAGKKVKCPKCGEAISVPEGANTQPPAAEPDVATESAAPEKPSVSPASSAAAPLLAACSCGATLKVPATAGGKTVKCPKCSNPVAVPSARSALPAEEPQLEPSEKEDKEPPANSAEPARFRPRPKKDDAEQDEQTPADSIRVWEESELLQRQQFSIQDKHIFRFNLSAIHYRITDPESKEEIGIADEKVGFFLGLLRSMRLYLPTRTEVRDRRDGPLLFSYLPRRLRPGIGQLLLGRRADERIEIFDDQPRCSHPIRRSRSASRLRRLSRRLPGPIRRRPFSFSRIPKRSRRN